MKNRRDFLRKTLGLGAGLAASPRLFAAPQESGAGMDMKHMGHATADEQQSDRFRGNARRSATSLAHGRKRKGIPSHRRAG